MKSRRCWHASAQLDGKWYVVGGTAGAMAATDPRSCWFSGCFLSGGEVYDPRNNSWSDLPPMSSARFGAAAAAVNGRLYVTGGFDKTSLNT
eukprot:3258841-Prymnesium_polylepis.1